MLFAIWHAYATIKNGPVYGCWIPLGNLNNLMYRINTWVINKCCLISISPSSRSRSFIECHFHYAHWKGTLSPGFFFSVHTFMSMASFTPCVHLCVGQTQPFLPRTMPANTVLLKPPWHFIWRKCLTFQDMMLFIG